MSIEQMENLKAKIEEDKISRMTPEQKREHQNQVREEGILEAKKPNKTKEMMVEINLELEEPGAASKI